MRRVAPLEWFLAHHALKKMPLLDLQSHVFNCKGIAVRTDYSWTWDTYVSFDTEKSSSWKSELISTEMGYCILNTVRKNDLVEVVVIMLGINNKVRVKISVYKGMEESDAGLKYFGEPCSIDVKEEDRNCFGVIFNSKTMTKFNVHVMLEGAL